MVGDTVKPQTMYLTDRTIRDDCGIFDWDMLLIVKPIGYPSSHLLGAESTIIHIAMKRVFIMITVDANGTKPGEKCVSAPRLSNSDLLHANFTPILSIPSHPSQFRRQQP